MHTPSRDESLAALAGQQHGVVSLTQLRAFGLDSAAVNRRLATGRLHRVHRGVYAVGHTALTEHGRLLAAVLACGPGAALSHGSAGRLWRLVKRAGPIEVTCRRARPPARAIVVRRSPLLAADRTTMDGLPLTTPARTLVDLADILTQPRLDDAVHEAEVRRIFDLRELEAAVKRSPGRRGRRKLERALAAWRAQPFTRSHAERLFLALCERHGLPRPLTNHWALGMEVDFFWPQFGLVVEIDGAATHLTRRSFVEDRRRDRVLTAAGLRVMRVVLDDLQGDGAALARELAAASRRRTTPRSRPSRAASPRRAPRRPPPPR